jgi:hypothetical protein
MMVEMATLAAVVEVVVVTVKVLSHHVGMPIWFLL